MLNPPVVPQQGRQTFRPLEVGVFFLSTAVLLTVFAGIVLSKKVAQKVEARQNQVSSLIQEVGTVRAENQKLKEIVKNNDINFEALARMIKEKAAKISEVVPVPPEAAMSGVPIQKVPVIQAIEPEQFVPEFVVADALNPQLNVLLVGHHGGLTDTIMLARFSDDDQTIHLLSIPRDFFVGGRKINEYYLAYGVGELVRQVESLTGVTVDHYAVLNMVAFTKIIDALSGIDVVVEQNIVDGLYPDGNLGVTAYSISKGSHHFNGEEALKFVRSRSSTSDFDRAKRQQKILAALKQKILEADFLENLDQAKSLYQGIFSLIETDIGFLDALQYLQKYRSYAVQTGDVLSTSNFLYSTRNLAGQYILLPKVEDYSEIQKYVRGLQHKTP